VPGETEVPDLALLFRVEQHVEDTAVDSARPRPRGRAGMQVPEVEVIGLHPAQRSIELAARPGGVAGLRLARQKDRLAIPGCEELPVADLAPPLGIAGRGIEVPDAAGDGRLDRLLREGVAGHVANVGAAEPEHRDHRPLAAELALGQQLAEAIARG